MMLTSTARSRTAACSTILSVLPYAQVCICTQTKTSITHLQIFSPGARGSRLNASQPCEYISHPCAFPIALPLRYPTGDMSGVSDAPCRVLLPGGKVEPTFRFGQPGGMNHPMCSLTAQLPKTSPKRNDGALRSPCNPNDPANMHAHASGITSSAKYYTLDIQDFTRGGGVT